MGLRYLGGAMGRTPQLTKGFSGSDLITSSSKLSLVTVSQEYFGPM